VRPWGSLVFVFVFRRDPNFFLRDEGNTTTFLIPRTALRGFFAILTTHGRNFFSALEGFLRPGGFGVNRACY
jgi:hypothetical protein